MGGACGAGQILEIQIKIASDYTWFPTPPFAECRVILGASEGGRMLQKNASVTIMPKCCNLTNALFDLSRNYIITYKGKLHLLTWI